MNRNKVITDVLREGRLQLKEGKKEQYALDCELFMMEATGFSRVQLYLNEKEKLSVEQESLFWEMVKKRCQGIPTQYILRKCEFMGLPFSVNESVLVPRPDTEILVETVLEFHKENSFDLVLDMGTGSGCIPISLAYYGMKKVIGVDISEDALEIAKKNAEKNKVSANLEWIQSDLFQNVPHNLLGAFDAILSNPPYIPSDEIPELMKEVREYEPSLALNGGKDGLDFYHKITREGKRFLKKDGFLFFEIGYNQAKAVTHIMQKHEFKDIEVRKDLAGLDRVVLGRR